MIPWIIKQEQRHLVEEKKCGVKYKGDVPGENGIVSSCICNKVDRETFLEFYAYNKVLLKNANLTYNFFYLCQNIMVAWLLFFIECY